MRPSSSDLVTPSQQNARPFLFLLLIAIMTVAIIALLPRAILSAASLGDKGVSVRNRAAASHDDQAAVAVLVRASDLLEAGGEGSQAQAAHLLDSLPIAPIAVREAGNTDNSGKNTPFSPNLIMMRLGRQMEKTAAAHPCAVSMTCSADQRADAFQWTFRCRKIADAVLIGPSPSLAALQVAHYLDTLAGRREIALCRAWGDAAGVQAATRRHEALRRVWNEQIMPLLSDDSLDLINGERGGKTRKGSPEEKEAEWQARVSLMVALYRKERPVVSAA